MTLRTHAIPFPLPPLQGESYALWLESRALRSNPFGDAWRREILVYCPPGIDRERMRLPMVVVLPAFGSKPRDLAESTPFHPGVFQRVETLVAEGRMPPAVVAIPDASTRWGGSQYLDSPGLGAYQSFVADEAVAAVEAEFGTLPKREGRAVVGRSSGGFGALRLAMDRPECFVAAASHAGDALFEMSLLPLLPRAARVLRRFGGVEGFAQDAMAVPQGAARATRQADAGLHDALFALVSWAAYAPDLDWMQRFPFDECQGAVDPVGWQACLQHDPVVRLESNPKALDGLDRLYLDCGQDDEFNLAYAHRRLCAVLASSGSNSDVELVAEEHAGGHRGTSWRFSKSLPAIFSAVASPEVRYG